MLAAENRAEGDFVAAPLERPEPNAGGDARVLAELREPRSSLTAWLRALRVHQWSKNALIFIPLFVGHAFGSIDNILHALAGFVLACLLASATYLVNDVADLADDRLHPSKRSRPLASGELSVASALTVAPALMLGTLICAYLVAPAFAASLLFYLFLTLSYSFKLKRLPLLDVFVISSLFGLRIVMGTAVIGLGYSPWLLSFSWAFFLSLALAKRHVEVMRAHTADLEDVAGRGYRGADWPVTLSFGVGAGLVSIVIMLLYLANDAAPSGFYHAPRWLYFIPLLMTLWLMRIWLLSNRMVLHDDPVVFALRDPASLLLGALTAAMFFLAL